MSNYKLEPWAHQLKVINHVKENGVNSYALFHDMGTGKTKTTIEILRVKCAKENRILKTLIICPLVVMDNWKREILTHSHIKEEAIQVLDGTSRPNGKKLKNANKKLRLEQIASGRDIFIMNTENVSNVPVWDAIKQLGIEFLVVDESHRFKAHKGKRTLNLFDLSRTVRHKLILTGSPILQNALDLWSQFYILNPNILGTNYFSFRSKYFYDTNANMPAHVHFPNFVPKDAKYFKKNGYNKEQSMEGLNEVIYRHASRVMKDEVLDLPDRVYTTVEVPFSLKQRKIYESMRDSLVAFIEEDVLKDALATAFIGIALPEVPLPELMSADLAIVKTLRLQQLVCGIFTNDDGEIKEIEHNRTKVLKDLLLEIAANKENKIIVWSVFTPTYKAIAEVCEELGIKFVFLTGEQSKEEKVENVDTFNNDPKVQVIIANQGAGGTGVNLTGANYEIYYSRSFVLEHDLQADARAYRGGQKRKTTRIDLLTPDTIDSKIVEALAKKREHAEDILAVRSKELTREEVLGMVR